MSALVQAPAPGIAVVTRVDQRTTGSHGRDRQNNEDGPRSCRASRQTHTHTQKHAHTHIQRERTTSDEKTVEALQIRMLLSPSGTGRNAVVGCGCSCCCRRDTETRRPKSSGHVKVPFSCKDLLASSSSVPFGCLCLFCPFVMVPGRAVVTRCLQGLTLSEPAATMTVGGSAA